MMTTFRFEVRMITKYRVRTSPWGIPIEVVQIKKETAVSVLINGRRIAKTSTYSSYFDTFGEAKAFLSKYAERRVSSAQRALENAQRYAEKINGLKET